MITCTVIKYAAVKLAESNIQLAAREGWYYTEHLIITTISCAYKYVAIFSRMGRSSFSRAFFLHSLLNRCNFIVFFSFATFSSTCFKVHCLKQSGMFALDWHKPLVQRYMFHFLNGYFLSDSQTSKEIFLLRVFIFQNHTVCSFCIL